MSDIPRITEQVMTYVVPGLGVLCVVAILGVLFVAVRVVVRGVRESTALELLRREGKDPVSIARAHYKAALSEHQEALRKQISFYDEIITREKLREEHRRRQGEPRNG